MVLRNAIWTSAGSEVETPLGVAVNYPYEGPDSIGGDSKAGGLYFRHEAPDVGFAHVLEAHRT